MVVSEKEPASKVVNCISDLSKSFLVTAISLTVLNWSILRTDFDEEYLNIFSRKILEQIRSGESNWEEHLPNGIAEMIKQNQMFGIKS